jgi:hypothetical protein
MAANQNGAVTFKRIFFRTHQRQTKAGYAGLHALQSSAKRGGPRNPVVTGDAINVAFTLRSTRPEFVAKKNVTDVRRPQRMIQYVAIELRKPGTVRTAPHVTNGFDALLHQQREELLPSLRRMADGKKVAHQVSKMVAQIL